MEPQPVSTPELLALALGEADADRAKQVRAAVAASTELAARLASAERLVEALRHAAEIEQQFAVDPDRVAALADATCPRAPALSRAAEVLREILATLVFDSRRAPALAPGFRGQSDERRLVFEGGGRRVEMSLVVHRRPIGETVAGEIGVLGTAGTPSSGGSVIARSGAAEFRAPIDPQGFFEFVAPPGVYRIEVRGEGLPLVIPEVDLGV